MTARTGNADSLKRKNAQPIPHSAATPPDQSATSPPRINAREPRKPMLTAFNLAVIAVGSIGAGVGLIAIEPSLQRSGIPAPLVGAAHAFLTVTTTAAVALFMVVKFNESLRPQQQ